MRKTRPLQRQTIIFLLLPEALGCHSVCGPDQAKHAGKDPAKDGLVHSEGKANSITVEALINLHTSLDFWPTDQPASPTSHTPSATRKARQRRGSRCIFIRTHRCAGVSALSVRAHRYANPEREPATAVCTGVRNPETIMCRKWLRAKFTCSEGEKWGRTRANAGEATTAGTMVDTTATAFLDAARTQNRHNSRSKSVNFDEEQHGSAQTR